MHAPEAAAMEFLCLGRDELDELTALEGLCFTLPWSKKQFAKAFDASSFAVFGLRAPLGEHPGIKGAAPLTAYIALYHNPEELEILNLAVAPKWRNRGCGTRLLRFALSMATKMGIGRAVLEVRSGNVQAIALYKGQGFTQVGRRRGYYHDSGEDALVLELSLRTP